MSLRKGHGTGAGAPRIEVMPPDELPLGVVQAPRQAESKSERRPNGTFTKGARTVQSEGGRSRRDQTRLARRLGLTPLPDDTAFVPYKRAAADFRRTHTTYLARTVGGGACGPGPSSIIATAAWQLAASRFLFDRGSAEGDPKMLLEASRLGDASRQNLLAAHELCAREAVARAEHEVPSWALPPSADEQENDS